VPRTNATVSGSWPTPAASSTDGYNRSPSAGAAVRPGLSALVKRWPTPTSSDGDRASDHYHHGATNPTLRGAVRAGWAWPTPNAMDAQSSGNHTENGYGETLTDAAVRNRWRTPTSSTHGARTGAIKERGRRSSDPQISLADQAVRWATPMASDWKGGRSASEYRRHSPTLAAPAPPASRYLRQGEGTATPGDASSSPILVLNPLFDEMLMGWPLGWTASTPLGTAWCRWLRQSRSAFSGIA
jgi:hypothetical protein